MLRGIAATMVLFVHLDIQLDRLNYGKLGTLWMAGGVDIFFVISGFIMWTSVERRGGMSPGMFLKNRLIRIVPIYWLVTSIVLAAAMCAPHLLNSTRIEPAHALASYLFLPARHPVTGHFWPLLIPGWSLNYEMLFYILFALALSLSGQMRAVRFGIIAVVLALVLLLGNLLKSRVDVMHFYANPVLLEFVAGVVLGIVCRADIVRSSLFWLPVAFVGFLLLWPGLPLQLGVIGKLVGATMIVTGAVFLPPLPHNPLSSLGDASYSLYLTHAIVLSALGFVWDHFFQPLGWALFVLAGAAAAFTVAVLMYTYVELPMTAFLKRLPLRRDATAMIAAAPGAPDPNH
jgi:exopolysaccharide production protein ExoZ